MAISTTQRTQHRVTDWVQTQVNASLVATTGTNTSAWFPCDGYAELSVCTANDAPTNNACAVDWSFDGINPHGNETVLAQSTTKYRAGTVSVKAPYFRVYLSNTDASTHIMNAYAYLKG